jgi:heme-degrading monooxygenase HmoA
MIVGVFKFKVNPSFQEEFEYLYGHAAKYVGQIDGYLGHTVYDGENGEKVLIVEFRDRNSFEVWDKHPEHKKYKERGKKEIFESYDVSVGEVFEKSTKP